MQKGSYIIAGLTALVMCGVAAPQFTRAQDSAAHAIPRQIMVKFEWVKIDSGKPDASREVEALTLLTEEDKTAQASSATSLNGLSSQLLYSRSFFAPFFESSRLAGEGEIDLHF